MRRRQKQSSALKKFLISVVLILFITGYFTRSWYSGVVETPVNAASQESHSFIVQTGESVGIIAQNLEEKGLIANKDIFKLQARFEKVDSKIVAGRFMLSPSMNMQQIMQALTDTTQTEVLVTIPEGSTVPDIDATLVKLGLINAGEFQNAVKNFDQYNEYEFLDKSTMSQLSYPLEGYLFPDTYFVAAEEFQPENLVQRMINNFDQKMQEVAWNKEVRTSAEIVIMASILEKEVRTSADMPIVSGILWKRLDNNWTIGADATLLYLKDDRTIDYDDLQEESPYNTRKNQGLPPGPINSPGIETLQAAANPEDSSHWFYLTTLDTGEVIYGDSNDEHNANKAKYL